MDYSTDLDACTRLRAADARRGLLEEARGGSRMRRRPKARGFAFLLTLLAALHVSTSADGASLARQCRRACRGESAACVAAGGRARACRRSTHARCAREGVAVCQGRAEPLVTTLADPTSLTATAKSTSE